ncbi:ATPase, P-type (transporting), HAD superfamily, subfamily IC [Micromonospora yangpuensis]|uniref:ATPase, P-type (Transporting), HAD superfamily, subfamily IC n=2 Tax=Micromonospora yangpuensis TaxID=683228 RepID=A0A1C6UNJ1_9ACTN|nr:ATPase, P-type (transporting), HAD superfamily, subfamily IC [Micromonospora yangpuensis]
MPTARPGDPAGAMVGAEVTAMAHDHPAHGGHDSHAGHDLRQFRRRFWLSLALTLPIVATSHLVTDWFGYRPAVAGADWVGPVFGTVVFGYGGWPFLVGGVREIRDRTPGMMLLVSMAIVVAYLASLATALGAFDLDFWWELAALVTIMLLGHWQETKAIGQARGALTALAALLPDDAERIDPDGAAHRVPLGALTVGDTVLVRAGARVPADGRIIDGAAELDESMITGDARPVAESVAAELGFRSGVDEVFAEVLPADKDRVVADLQARGLRVAMVGDGVNDAPALARADVGLAIGAGTDVAIESAGVVLASSDPRGVGAVIRLSRASYRKMRQNLAWAAGYNVVALPLAAGALAWAGFTLSPAVGAILMSASTIVVALNAQLLRRVRLTPD